MGLLVEGEWRDQWYDTKASGGKFVRSESAFRNWITPDGAPGPSGIGGYAAEADRYHLYIAYACPWAHRAMMLRTLKGLEDMISFSAVHWRMKEFGWTFEAAEDPTIGDPIYGAGYLHQVYTAVKPDMTGRVTVPILFDKKTRTIVSNESSEIIRMLNTAFDGIGAKPDDYYPKALRGEIDAVNERVYHTLNNGVYKSGFATTQNAYEEAVVPLFETLDWLEDLLSKQRYLAGDRLTEADWRLFATLVRFDSVYVSHFKCSIRRLIDYPALWAYTRELYQVPGIAGTVKLDQIKAHYYESHETVNPTGIVPMGPDLDFMAPHGRDVLKAA